MAVLHSEIAMSCNNDHYIIGPYFTAVDLASIAESLDDEERQRMAEGDIESEEFQRFLQQPSSNMDDSGFFSIQVLYILSLHRADFV
jgi:hypothetical protein